MPSEPRHPAAMPDPKRIVNLVIGECVGYGLSGREASELMLKVMREMHTACYTGVYGHGASPYAMAAWFTQLLDAAGEAVRINKQT